MDDDLEHTYSYYLVNTMTQTHRAEALDRRNQPYSERKDNRIMVADRLPYTFQQVQDAKQATVRLAVWDQTPSNHSVAPVESTDPIRDFILSLSQ